MPFRAQMMPASLPPASKQPTTETLHTSQWSIQHFLRKGCDVTQALGAVFMTQVDGGKPQFKSCYRIAKALAEDIVDQFINEPFCPGKTSYILKTIGMSPIFCLSVSTLIHQSENGNCTHARLIVILPAERQFINQRVNLLQDILNDIGLALDFYQRHSSYFTRFIERPGLKTCLVCENIHHSNGEWIRWNELLVRQLGASLSHTICSHCAFLHYPEYTGAKNASQNAASERNSIFNTPLQEGRIDVCAICEYLKNDSGVWVRWDEYIKRVGRISFTHTLCCSCSGQNHAHSAHSVSGDCGSDI